MLTKSVVDQLTNCKVFSTVSQNEDENAWLYARTRGIGGSDIGTICGVNNWASIRTVYLAKTGQYEDETPLTEFSEAAKERMEFGHLLEPIVADKYARHMKEKHDTEIQTVIVKATFQHKDYPWALANVDRFLVDKNGKLYGVLECKTAGEFLNEEWSEGDLPISYLYQLNWYLFVTGLEYGAIACVVGGNKFYHYEMYRNDELIKEMLEKADKFWNYNVKQLVQPELDSSDESSKILKDAYCDVQRGSEIVLDGEDINELARVVAEGKAEIKRLEKIVEEASNRIKEKIGFNEIGHTRDHVIKWSPRTRTSIDTTALKIEMPHIYNRFAKVTNYRVFTLM